MVNNGGGGLPNLQDNTSQVRRPWISLTPENFMETRSYQVPADTFQNLVGSTSYGHLRGMPNSYMQTQNVSLRDPASRHGEYSWYDGGLGERNRMINHIAGSYTQGLYNNSTSWNNLPFEKCLESSADFVTNRSMGLNMNVAQGGPLIPDLHSYVGSNIGGVYDSLVPHHSHHWNLSSHTKNTDMMPDIRAQVNSNGNDSFMSSLLLRSKNYCSDSTPLDVSNYFNQMPQYDLNSVPRTETNSTSTIANLTHIAPMTPDPAKVLGSHHFPPIPNFRIDEGLSLEKDKQTDFITMVQDESTRQQCSELLQNIGNSSSAAVSTPFREMKSSDKERGKGIDLNKTPWQKQPKRRKHRPKVVIEGKTKRTPSKPTATEDNKENPSGKRKYVRRKGLKGSAIPPEDVNQTIDCEDEPAAKTCRRALDFEEMHRDDIQKNDLMEEMQERHKRTYDLFSKSQATKLGMGMERNVSARSSALKDNSMIQNSQTATTDLTSIHRMLTNRLEVPSWGAAVEPSTTSNFQQLGNLDVGGRIPDKGNSVSLQGRYVSTQQHMHSAGIGRFANQGKSISDNEKPHLKAQSPGIVPEVLPNLNEPRGQKRDHSQTTTHRNSGTIDASGQSRSCQDILQVDEYHRHGISSSMGSEIRKKIENGLYENISIMCSGIAASSIGDNESAKRQNEGISGYTGDRWIQYMASQHNLEKQHFSLAQLPHAERVRGQNELAMVYTNSSLKIVESHHMHSQPPSIWSSAQGIEQAPRNFHGEVRTKKQPTGSTSSELVSSVTNKVQEDDVNSFQQSSQLGKGNLADVTTCQLGDSNLNERSNEVARQQEDAIVLYKGGGAVVPYDESELMKQRKLRPKVDLDSETEKVWNLLMGKESNEGLHGTDKEKEKWWEEERKIFRGRADSFIARMHLVQGDRRFSQWKGSVVDSVIGVFLTQNVSDHLSSSAFMCLAARFPLKSISNRRTCNEAETNILIEDPEDSTLSPQDSIKWSEQAFAEPSSVAPEISARCWSHTATTATEKCLVEAQNLSVEEEISSQDSFDSSMTRGTGEIRSCSGSNSEADLPTGSRKTDVSNLENSSMFREFFSCVNGSSVFDEGSEHGGLKDRGQGLLQSELDMIDTLKEQFSFSPNNMASLQMEVPAGLSNNCLMEKIPNFEVREVDSSRAFSDESMSSWPSIASGLTTENDLVYENLSFRELLGIMDKSPEKHIRLLRSDEAPTMGLNQSISKQSVRQQCNGVESGPCRGCDQPSPDTHQDEANKIFQFECTSIPKTSGVDETFGIGKPAPTEDNQIQIANEFVEPNSKFQDHSSQAYDEKNVSIPKAKKGMDEGQKKNTFDWDILRKNALADSSKKERSKDTRDSLDYEALRSANVREVAKAIEERGMNNMLAERIQDFLNRLVKDHGSMDLEWLRDVPPDKAKDYLLSIRGIGLKSVECVRLLTLHQLAFPVDTNVGRIAVRLGWVPLRPLPESMQIHLLEQYPVLESVQKYLWPRLCKLDQRTLYELHYQLITFGKVFCTKKNPNCNACPMRGECRHFASAFASARFALPGTEERGLVSSTNPITAEMQPAVVINLLPLPPPEESLPLGTPVNSKCEPIIEVPETPDQECTEASELQDMEDLFVDPDEIPTIKLDMEELLTTIQSLPNGDMSRALVALNPEAASLPTPKLKNVNKLRTEHQVYELPDSHPLLKGRDRREPDDPSPYLLAIWTPGETADSIQPPEKSCETQGSNRLCDRETCFSCSSRREANSQTVRGTLLIPCRTAMRGRFPLNGTYFQVNEVFADDVSSVKPIDVPREWIWNLRRRTVYFGTSVSSIFRGLTTEGIQYCFWRGFVCVRGFDQKSRAPRPLKPRLHYPASKLKTKKGKKDKET